MMLRVEVVLDQGVLPSPVMHVVVLPIIMEDVLVFGWRVRGFVGGWLRRHFQWKRA